MGGALWYSTSPRDTLGRGRQPLQADLVGSLVLDKTILELEWMGSLDLGRRAGNWWAVRTRALIPWVRNWWAIRARAWRLDRGRYRTSRSGTHRRASDLSERAGVFRSIYQPNHLLVRQDIQGSS